jgi:tetratricopeptide (TPR) repeat protein
MRSNIRTILLALVCGAICQAALQAQPPADRLRQAEELMKAARPDEAFAAYEEAIETAAGRPAERRAARFAYAQALTLTGRHDAAAAEYQAAIDEGGGRDAIAYFNLGNARARAGRHEQAAAAYRRAVEQRYGRYSRARNNLGLVLARLGRLDEARDEYLKAIAEESGHYADAHYNLALLYWRQGDAKSAEKHLTRARRDNPNHEDAAILLAEITAGSRPEAANQAETVVSAPPDAATNADQPAPAGKPSERDLAIIRNAATAAAAVPASVARPTKQSPLPPAPKTAPPQPPSVVSNPTSAGISVSVPPAAFRSLQQAREARREGNLDRAATLYRAALQSAGRDVAPMQWELAEVLMRLDRPSEAAELYRRVITVAGDRYPSAYYNLGRAMMGEGKHAGAVVMLKQALTRLGQQSYIYLALSEALERSENINGALEALSRYAALREKERADAEEKEWYERKLASLRERLR